MQLSYTLNLMGDGDTAAVAPISSRGPGFVLHEVEGVLTKVRDDLDCPYSAQKTGEGGKDTVPLMMRLRDHINAVSAVLTGNSVRFATVDSTTLHELIDSLAVLNASVCCHKDTLGCTIQ